MGRKRGDYEIAKVAGTSAESERRQGLRAIGSAASRLAAPIVARRGGGVLGRLKADWAAVVGVELGSATWPDALGRDGALKLRVTPILALELQHRAPLVIERINLFCGRAVVARLVLVQGPLPLAAPPPPALPTPLSAGEAQALDTRLDEVADPGLRTALARLGRLVLAGPRRGD